MSSSVAANGIVLVTHDIKKYTSPIVTPVTVICKERNTQLRLYLLRTGCSPVPEGGSVCVACTRSFSSDHS